jgi:hypothetical protein
MPASGGQIADLVGMRVEHRCAAAHHVGETLNPDAATGRSVTSDRRRCRDSAGYRAGSGVS